MQKSQVDNIWCGSMFQSPRKLSLEAVVVPTAYVLPFIWNTDTLCELPNTTRLRSKKWNEEKPIAMVHE